ncbi:hypothetical protein C7435_0175 [Maricaulis maris]|uniref:Chromosome segregation ATPase-like protein n=2 Tax=Maricaulis maris TaxID=74318 RepID=A0A495DLC5_9PROT|nr:hypothetical protein C7435_0175 [Maricaulis maris]
MEGLLESVGERFGLVVHIGCGEAAGRSWQGRVDDLVLVEPDPERAQAVRGWLEESGAGSLVEAAVMDRLGEAHFRRTSFGDMNSVREHTGATTLFPGLQYLESVPVQTVRARDLLDGRNVAAIEGLKALVVEPPSEVLVVLSDLDEAGLLDQFDAVVVCVAETALHDGGADRKMVTDWLEATNRHLVWEADSVDPDMRFARVEKNWKALSLTFEQGVREFELVISDLRETYALQFDQDRAILDSLQVEMDALATEREQAVREARAAQDALSEACSERDRLRREMDALATEREQAAGKVQATLEALSEARLECDQLRDAMDTLTTEREQAMSEAQTSLEALSEARLECDQLRGAMDTLTTEREQAMSEAQTSLEALSEARLECDQLRDAMDTLAAEREEAASEAASLDVDALSEARLECDRLRSEMDALAAEREKIAADAQAAQNALSEACRERDRLRGEMDVFTTEREQAASEAQATLDALSEVRLELDQLKGEKDVLEDRLVERNQAAQRASAELEALRDDNRLSLRIQRIAQADLADLQDRFAALADEKLQLERFFDDLAQKVSRSMGADQAPGAKASPKRVGARTRPTAKSSSKSTKVTSRAKSS